MADVVYKGQVRVFPFTGNDSGLTWTAYVSKDNTGFTGATGVASTISGTQYQFAASTDDTNADNIQFLLVSSNGSTYESGQITTFALSSLISPDRLMIPCFLNVS